MDDCAEFNKWTKISFTSGYAASDIQQLMKSCPHRETEVLSLLEKFGRQDEAMPASLFVYGHSGSGKTHTIKQIARVLKLPHCYINSVEVFTQKLLFETILQAVKAAVPAEQTCDVLLKCDHMSDFVNSLQKIAMGMSGKPFIVVIDGAERLRSMGSNILATLLRLGSLVGANICTVLITEVIWEKFLANTSFKSPHLIHFQDYNRDALLRIMSLDCPDLHGPEMYSTYCKLVLGVFHLVCRDLTELRHLASSYFTEYCRPVQEDNVSETDVRKLWRNIEPHLRNGLHTVYHGDQSASRAVSDTPGGVSSKAKFELPYYAKYLLIASYLASCNPARTDRRYFSKTGVGKMSKRAKHIAKKNTEMSYQGPKAFSLDRMMAMFYSIVEGGATPCANILSQVSSLVALNFLVRSSAETQIDCPKYKCVVSFSFIETIAKTLNCDLAQYLHIG